MGSSYSKIKKRQNYTHKKWIISFISRWPGAKSAPVHQLTKKIYLRTWGHFKDRTPPPRSSKKGEFSDFRLSENAPLACFPDYVTTYIFFLVPWAHVHTGSIFIPGYLSTCVYHMSCRVFEIDYIPDSKTTRPCIDLTPLTLERNRVDT